MTDHVPNRRPDGEAAPLEDVAQTTDPVVEPAEEAGDVPEKPVEAALPDEPAGVDAQEPAPIHDVAAEAAPAADPEPLIDVQLDEQNATASPEAPDGPEPVDTTEASPEANEPEEAPETVPAEEPEDAPGEVSVGADDVPVEADEVPGGPVVEVPVEAPTPDVKPPSLAARCFNGLAHAGWLVLLLLTGAVTAMGLVVRPVALPADAHWSGVLEQFHTSGNWLFFLSNGNVFTDLPPIYIWFLAGLERLPLVWTYLSPTLLPQAGTAFALALCVLCTWILARGTGHSPRAALAAGCLLLVSLTISGFSLCAGPGLLFTSLLLLSLFFLYRGWVAQCAPLSLLAGFVLAAAATLTQNPFGMALPLWASLVFLLWRGTFRRAGQRDGAFGFAAMLILTLGWLTWLAMIPEAKPYLAAVLQQWQVRDVSTVMTSWWLPFVVLAVLARPWTLLLLVLPWERFYRIPVLFWQNRHNAPGSGWIVWSLLGGLALLPFMAGSAVSAALPLLPLLAIAGGKALMDLTPVRSRLFFGLLGLLLLVLAAATGLAALLPRVATWVPSTLLASLENGLAQLPCAGSRLVPLMPLLDAVQGLGVVAGTSFVAAVLLLKITNKAYPGGGLLLFTLSVVALVQPVLYLTVPSLLAYFAR